MTSSATQPEPEFIRAGQVYAFVRAEPYRRRDGTETVLHVYRTGRATCGDPFEVRIPGGGSRWLSRQCAKHHRPGIKVR